MQSLPMVPDKAKEAAFALAAGWNSSGITDDDNSRLAQMRKTAIDAISLFGFANDSVYENLERSYFHNLRSDNPDFDEIRKTLNAFTEQKNERTIELLYKFLNELHGKRGNHTWGSKENKIFFWIVSSLKMTGTKSKKIMMLLYTILRTEIYTMQERLCAKDALIELRKQLTTS